MSQGTDTIAFVLRSMKLDFEREFRFHFTRKWRADFRLTRYPILIEFEGGAYTNGRHTRGKGYTADIEKYNAAILDEWVVLRFTTDHIKKPDYVKDCVALAVEMTR